MIDAGSRLDWTRIHSALNAFGTWMGHGDTARHGKDIQASLLQIHFHERVSLVVLLPRHNTASQTNQAPTACIDSHALTHTHPDNQVRRRLHIESVCLDK